MNYELTKAFLFDMDGVLFDSMPNHAVAWEAAVKKHGLLYMKQACRAVMIFLSISSMVMFDMLRYCFLYRLNLRVVGALSLMIFRQSSSVREDASVPLGIL